MLTTTSSSKRQVDLEAKECLVCGNTAYTRNYGIFSCSACKMFFHRTLEKKLQFICKGSQKCSTSFNVYPKCRACRYEKCLRVGMRYEATFLEIEDPDKACKLLKDLSVRDSQNYSIFSKFYSLENPSLEDILKDRNSMKLVEKKSGAEFPASDLLFLGAYSRVSYFLDFDFIKTMSDKDKMILLKYHVVRNGSLARAMKSFVEKRSLSGEYTSLQNIFQSSQGVLNRVVGSVIAKFIELNVTMEEYLLLVMIYFCDPSISGELSNHAKNILSTHQQAFCSALFQNCQLNHQKAAPSRFTDLLSICNINNRAMHDVQYFSMMVQIYVPDLKFKKLVHELFFDF